VSVAHRLWWWYATWPEGLRSLTLAVSALCFYSIPAVSAAYPIARWVRRHASFANRVFAWLRRAGRRSLYPFMVGGIFVCVFSVFDAPTVHPVDVLWQRLIVALPGMAVLCGCQTLMLLSWLDEGGFLIETTGRGTGSLHIHRKLDKVGTRAFLRWLPRALAECHRMGMHSVCLVSPLLHETHRVERLMAVINEMQISVDGLGLSMSAQKISRTPMVGPAAWGYWCRYGRFQLPMLNGGSGIGRRLLARVWRRQSGLQVTYRASAEARQSSVGDEKYDEAIE
jgi:hypothetical protein